MRDSIHGKNPNAAIYYEIAGDFHLSAFNQAVRDRAPGIQIGDFCYKAIMKGDRPCEHCPIVGNTSQHVVSYYDAADKKHFHAAFSDIGDGHVAVIAFPAGKDSRDFIIKSFSASYAAVFLANTQTRELLNLHMTKGISSRYGSAFLSGDYAELLSAFLDRDVLEDDRRLFDPLYDLSGIRRLTDENGIFEFEFRLLRDGEPRYIQFHLSAPDEDCADILIGFRNVDETVHKFLEMSKQTDTVGTDELTGLYTREAFFYHAKELLKKDPCHPYDIMILDISGFKVINGIYGEATGNKILKSVARFCLDYIRDAIWGRYGSDQFAAIAAADEWREINVNVDERLFNISNDLPVPRLIVKMGACRILGSALDVRDVCGHALIALSSIKDDPSRNVAYYDGSISKKHLKALNYESRFDEAIRKKEFVPYFQPKMDPFTGKVVGAEALVRWKNKDGTVEFPIDLFLSVYEKNGQIVALDEYMFGAVCRYQAEWKKQGRTPIPITVNLSRMSMHSADLVERYRNIISVHRVDPKYMPIEITESAAIASSMVKPIADAMHDAGFLLQMDDFGSGESSINSLTLLKFETIKLDKSLIDTIGDERGELTLIFLMGLIKKLGLKVVAEGVETETQKEFLMKHSCDAIQGYYYSKPLPCEEFEQYVKSNLGPNIWPCQEQAHI